MRFLVGILILVSWAHAAHAQPFATDGLRDCRLAAGETLSLLEARQKALVRDIAAANPKESQPGSALRKRQEELLSVAYKVECLKAQASPADRGATRRFEAAKPAPPTPPPAAPGPAAPASSTIVEVPLYYATDRKPGNAATPASAYGSGADGTLHYGRAVVSIPPGHTPGNIELPQLWKLERTPNPARHFVLKSVTSMAANATLRDMTQKLTAGSAKTLLLFVHGYNTSFADAALRTAQISHDLRFKGLSMFYSWPSAGDLLGYWQDEEATRLSERSFERLVDEVAKLPVSDIYIVAHSMGNRIVGHALQARAEKGKSTRQLREVLLAAPDINAEIFRKEIAPRLAAMTGTRTTIYASSSDMALVASKLVHRFQRVGETQGGIFTFPGIETIDASTAARASRGYGHNYLMDSLAVLKDITAIIDVKATAQQRGLGSAGVSPNTYWRLP